MRIAVITDSEGTIRAVANCEARRDNVPIGELHIGATPARRNVAGEASAQDIEELQSHIVDVPDRLVGKGLEDIVKLAYLDTTGDRPTLCVHRKMKKA